MFCITLPVGTAIAAMSSSERRSRSRERPPSRVSARARAPTPRSRPLLPFQCRACDGRLFRIDEDRGVLWCECGESASLPQLSLVCLLVCHLFVCLFCFDCLLVCLACLLACSFACVLLRPLDPAWCVRRLAELLPRELAERLYTWQLMRELHSQANQ